MKRISTGIKTTGTEFTTGVVFTPTWDDLHAIIAKMNTLGLLNDLVPEINVTVILAHRGPMTRTVPLILERSHIRRYPQVAPDSVLAMLWVVACFNYKYCQGPYPGTLKRYKRPRRKPVREFRCPYCARQFIPNPRFKNRKVVLGHFISWLVEHAVQCDNLLSLDRSVK
jgi:hypothetical protein